MSHIAVKAAASAGAGAAVSVIPLAAGAPELAPLIGWAVGSRTDASETQRRRFL